MDGHRNAVIALAAGLAIAGCGHIPPDVTTRRAPRDLQPGPDHALLVIVQPQNSGLAWMVFTALGEWLARDEAVLDDAGVERLRLELARFPGLVDDAEARWRG
jgi:hypothetical protein